MRSSGSVSVTFDVDLNAFDASQQTPMTHSAGAQLGSNPEVFTSRPGSRSAFPHPERPKSVSVDVSHTPGCTPADTLPPEDNVDQLQWPGRSGTRLENLESVVEERLQTQGIDLTAEPFSDEYGRYGIPRSLVQRFSDELDRSEDDVAVAMDTVRVRELLNQRRLAVSISGMAVGGFKTHSEV